MKKNILGNITVFTTENEFHKKKTTYKSVEEQTFHFQIQEGNQRGGQ